ATEEAAELAGLARGVVAAVSHERWRGDQVTRSLGRRPARQGRQEPRDIRRRGRRGIRGRHRRRRLGHGLREEDEGEEGEEHENGLFHTFISWLTEPAGNRPASKGEGARAHPGRVSPR